MKRGLDGYWVGEMTYTKKDGTKRREHMVLEFYDCTRFGKTKAFLYRERRRKKGESGEEKVSCARIPVKGESLQWPSFRGKGAIFVVLGGREPSGKLIEITLRAGSHERLYGSFLYLKNPSNKAKIEFHRKIEGISYS